MQQYQHYKNMLKYQSKTKKTGNPAKLLAEFDPNPSSKMLKRKIEFFYLPYYKQHNINKHMRFESQGAKQSLLNQENNLDDVDEI